jgi:ubiquitin carboxyl-terminal hydrolase 4/11/15
MRIPRPSTEAQKKTIEDIVFSKAPINAGDTYYIISKKWFRDWESFVQAPDSGDAPGPIDNQSLISDGDTLRIAAEEYRDYELIAEEAWNLLYQWYTGGPALPRKAIKLNNRTHVVVEVRLLNIHFSHKDHGTISKSISKVDTIGETKKQICSQWNLDPAGIKVYDIAGDEVEETKQIGELHLADGQQIDVTDQKMTICDQVSKVEEVANQSMSDTPSYTSSSSSSYSYYPSNSYPYSYNSSYSNSYSSFYDSKPKVPPPPGLVGLNNLGNTCFMNSSLQCLSNTVPLVEFFLSGAYLRDVNVDNPLGSKGLLAEAFARLVKELWNGQNSSVAPREFKSRLEDFAPQFSGYQQHDSQELLAFLLDGLHEDLNRVRNKLYASQREGDDISDEVREKEAWGIHKNRNDSVIVDWFQASLKSTLVCPTCDRVSVTFDPFMYLSLPLPMKIDRSIPLTLIPQDVLKPITKYLVKVPKTGTIGTLKAKLGELTGISPDCLILTDVFNHKFFKKFGDNDSIDVFDEERDVMYAHEVLPQPADAPPYIYCAVYNRKDEIRNTHYVSMQYNTQLFGTPFFVSVPPDTTYTGLYELIKASVSRWFRPPAERVLDRDDNRDNGHPLQTDDSSSDSDDSDDEEQEPEKKDESEEEAGYEGDSNDTKVAKHVSEEKVRMFSLVAVDSHGYHETQLYDNSGPLDLEYRTTIAVHWKPLYLDLFEDSKFAVKHSSMNTLDPLDPDEITLDKCLSLYTTLERLGPEDPWYCNKCKEHRQATKKFDLWNSPRVLVVHLKRFSYRNKYFREKLETLVTYPLKGLDLSRHIIGPLIPAPIYDLYAVSNHYGSLGGGHYTAYALNKSTDKWYKFDDSSVSEIDESHVVSSSAYVLFYRRRDTYLMTALPPTNEPPATVETPAPTATTTTAPASDEGDGVDAVSASAQVGYRTSSLSHMDLD